MAKRMGGFRRKTRRKLRKNIRLKGKISITRYLQEFNVNDRVQLLAEPAIQKGMYFPRFYGKAGIIKNKRGSCYEVNIKDGGKKKTLIVHPVHMKKI